jgi:UDP-N-acetylmuramyl pentapeptide synthase
MRKDGTILVNQDDPQVLDLAREFFGQKITFGVEHPADVMAKEIRLRGSEGVSFRLISGGEEMKMFLPLFGRHFVPNALCAMAVARFFGIELKKAKEALEHLKPFPMRMEIHHIQGGKTLINDTYNANPKSMAFALETLVEAKGKGRAIAVLGDMLELGDFTEEAHRKLGEEVGKLSVDLLVALGEESPVVTESAIRYGLPPERAWVVGSHSEAVSILRRMIQEGDWILVKGSRKMAMERIVEGLVEKEVQRDALSSSLSSS